MSSTGSTSSNATISTRKMEIILERLKGQKNRESTKANYLSIWRKFNNFVMKLDVKPKSWEQRMSLYCAYLVDRGVQSSMIKCYKSAMKCMLVLDNYKWDDNKVLLSAITGACKIINDRVRARFPIQIGLLEIILFELGRYFDGQKYLEILYKTMFILGYYGLLRVGEITSSSQHTLKAKNIHIGKNKDKILIILYSSKTHGAESKPQEIKIQADTTTPRNKSLVKRHFSPFNLTRQYLTLRGDYKSDDEPFFIFQGGTHVTANHMRNMLHKMLSRLNINTSLYNTHSLRGSRSCDLIKYGYTLDQVKMMGHWRSNAVYKYLK